MSLILTLGGDLSDCCLVFVSIGSEIRHHGTVTGFKGRSLLRSFPFPPQSRNGTACIGFSQYGVTDMERHGRAARGLLGSHDQAVPAVNRLCSEAFVMGRHEAIGHATFSDKATRGPVNDGFWMGLHRGVTSQMLSLRSLNAA